MQTFRTHNRRNACVPSISYNFYKSRIGTPLRVNYKQIFSHLNAFCSCHFTLP